MKARTAPFLRVTVRRALEMRVSLMACSLASSEYKAVSCRAGTRERVLAFPKGVAFFPQQIRNSTPDGWLDVARLIRESTALGAPTCPERLALWMLIA